MKNTTKKNKKNKLDKAYLKQIQNEIDDLERQLFSYDDNINKFKEDKLILNKNLDEPYIIKNKEENKNEENNIQLEYNELDKVRKAQNEKYKQSENKCKLLEKHNYNLKNNMEMLQREKIEQEKKIIELQKEIDELRREKSKEIQYKNEKLKETFNQNFKK